LRLLIDAKSCTQTDLLLPIQSPSIVISSRDPITGDPNNNVYYDVLGATGHLWPWFTLRGRLGATLHNESGFEIDRRGCDWRRWFCRCIRSHVQSHLLEYEAQVVTSLGVAKSSSGRLQKARWQTTQARQLDDSRGQELDRSNGSQGRTEVSRTKGIFDLKQLNATRTYRPISARSFHSHERIIVNFILEFISRPIRMSIRVPTRNCGDAGSFCNS